MKIIFKNLNNCNDFENIFQVTHTFKNNTKNKTNKKKEHSPQKNKKQKPKSLNCVLQTDDSLRMTWEGDLDMEQEA